MSNIGYSTLTVIPSLKGMGASITGQAMPLMASAGTAGGTKFGTAAGVSAVGSFKGAIGPLIGIAAGLGIGSAIASGIEAGVAALGSAVTAAGSLQQSLGGVKAVFGDSASGILEWGKTAASAVGLTRDQYSQLATVLGSQLKNGGTSLDELGTKTNDLIGLGADLASMFGGTTEDAVAALSATLRGERDSIEKYGVSLTQAAVDAKAAELGFGKVGGALTTQASQAATLALVYEQTAAAQGNFAKESGTLEGAQQRLNASLGDFQAKLGTAMLPAISKLIDIANKELVPTLGVMADEIGPQLGAALTESTPALVDLAKAAVPLVRSLIELAVSALPGVVTALQIVTPILTWTTDTLSGGYTAWAQFFRLLSGDTSLRQVGERLSSLGGVWANLTNVIGGAYNGMRDALNGIRSLFTQATDTGRYLAEGLVRGVTSGMAGLANALTAPVRSGIATVKNLLGIKSPSRVFFAIGQNTGLGMVNGLRSTAGAMDAASDVLIPRAPAIAAPSVTGGGFAGNLAAALANTPVYVQNPFTGEYLLAKVDERAEGVVARADDAATRDYRNGFR